MVSLLEVHTSSQDFIEETAVILAAKVKNSKARVRDVEIRNFTQLRQKNTSLGNHFRFVIFSLFQFVSFRNVYKPKGVENLVNGFRPA